MTDKEKVVAMLDNVPPDKMGFIVGYIQGLIADTALPPEDKEPIADRRRNV